MTQRLPSNQQFKRVVEPLQATRDAAFTVAVLENGPDSCVAMRKLCISRLKEAAEALGYELVDRVPSQPQPDKEANGGGRMDMAAVADA